MRTALILFLFFLLADDSFCQNRNSVWCFGDSAGIDFSNINNPLPIGTGFRTRGSCASVSDSFGNLLFYANTRATVPGNTTLVYNNQNQIMQNGNNIVGEGWYHELVIIPKPEDDSIYYLFSIGITGSSILGLYYSLINISSDSIIQKNVQLIPDQQADCISAIKHGNGRDWWIVGRHLDFSMAQWNNEYYTFLITSSSISGPNFQNIGSMNYSGFNRISFSPSGDTLLFTNAGDVIEYFNFDRCTGLLSNPVTIRPAQISGYSEWTWGNEFSSNGRFIYTSTSKDTTQLFQYDLQAANPLASRVVLYQSTFPSYCGGDVKRAPDGKIYFSIAYENIVSAYPYPDSIYNMYNMNLSVINYPDSLGAACDFQPYSFYLGGKRTYYGLPNNPDYELGAVTGSICDSLTGIINTEQGIKSELFVYYNSSWQKAFINAKGLKGRNLKISVFDLLGNVIYTEEAKLFSEYFTKDLNAAAFAKGMYIVNLVTEKERLVKKFIKD